MNKQRLFLTFVIIFSSLSCTKKEIVSPTIANADTETNVIVIDTVIVKHGIDISKGFPNPTPFHYVLLVTHLVRKGTITSWEYSSGEAHYSNWWDVDGLGPAGRENRLRTIIWLSGNSSPGQLQYQITITAVIDSFKSIERTIQGYNYLIPDTVVHPIETESLPVTSPDNRVYNCFLSKDHTWAYYQIADKYMFQRVPVRGGPPEQLFTLPDNNRGYAGEFSLINSDSIMIYSLNHPNSNSKLIETNLFTGHVDTVALQSSIWDAPIIPITHNKAFTQSNPNNSSTSLSYLVSINLKTGNVDTVLNNGRPVSEPIQYGSHPPDGNPFFTLEDDLGNLDLFYVDPVTLAVAYDRTLLPAAYNPNGGYPSLQIAWAPNGIDFVFSKDMGMNWEENTEVHNLFIVQNGVQRQLTFYPSADVACGLSDNYLIFTTNRRGHNQLWSVTY